jgi:hypothetical protein
MKGRIKTLRDNMNLLGMNMAPRRNRRRLVALTYLGLIALWAITSALAGTRSEPAPYAVMLMVTSLLVNGILFGGYGRWGLIKPFATCTPIGSPTPWHNDERELHRRDRMHFYAYRIVLAFLIFAFFLGTRPFQHPQLSHNLVLAGIVLGLTLPQALLLWVEPDMEFEDPAGLEHADHAQ